MISEEVMSEKEKIAHRHNIRVIIHNDCSSLTDELRLAGIGSRGANRLVRDSSVMTLLIENLRFDQAFLLKEEFSALGGAGAIADTLAARLSETGTLALTGRKASFQQLPYHLEKGEEAWAIAESCVYTIENYFKSEFDIPYHGGKLRIRKRPLIMGILNVTPDSFYDGGRYITQSSAVERGLRLAEAGADILDIGGESTRPGAEPVSYTHL
ncbi:MAG: dihydropteroate synthase, partial [Planctomycetota bacterium]|nr:dihydropteroate synthase [Planctomycetota bacterium]